MSKASKPLTCVAIIVGAHGVHGAVKVKSFTQNPEDFSIYGPLLDADGKVFLTPKNPRPVGKHFAMRSAEITTREQAIAFKGTQLFVPRDVLPEPEEDEFYYTDLVGLEVKTTDGKRLGVISGVHDFGAGVMLEILPIKSAENQNSFYHPFTKAAVPKVDLKAKRVVVHIEETIMGRAPSQPTGDETAEDATECETAQNEID